MYPGPLVRLSLFAFFAVEFSGAPSLLRNPGVKVYVVTVKFCAPEAISYREVKSVRERSFQHSRYANSSWIECPVLISSYEVNELRIRFEAVA